MAKTSPVYARIDTDLKENAENILHRLGISPSSAIQMLYSQIILTKSFPISLKLPYDKPKALGSMSHDELNAELSKGYESIQSGHAYTADEVDAMLDDAFDLL